MAPVVELLVGFGVDCGTLRFDDLDGFFEEINGSRSVTFLFGDAGTIIEDQPVNLAVFLDLGNFQQLIETGLGFSMPASFE